jgi:thermitase
MENVQSFWQEKRNRVILLVCVVLLVVVVLLWQSFLSGRPSSTEQSTQPTSAILPSGAPVHLVPSVKNGLDRVPGQLLVKFKSGVSQQTITTVLTKYHASIQRTISGINTTVILVPKGQEDTILQQLKKEGVVEYSEPNYIRRIQYVPNDPSFPQQWGLANTGQSISMTINGSAKTLKGTPNDDIHAETAWDVSKGDGIKVAVLDTGIDLSHPDLAGKVVAQKVFVSTATTTIDDKFGHGTHVAGIIAANTNNGQGVAGTCPNCQLLIGKAMDDQGNGQDADMANAITWAADNGAKVINMSEGGNTPSQTEDAAINYAWNKGAVIIAAAGNNGSNQLFYPAASPNVISVAATDNVNALASFSDYGSWVNLAAPGLAILSTLPTHTYAMQAQEPLKTNYDYLSGTSMAAPIVSGVAALVWTSQYGTSNAAVVQRILNTATKINGTGTKWKDGFIDAAAAVGTLTTTPTPTLIATKAPTQIPTQQPTPTNAVHPTLFCLGSCPTEPPTATPRLTSSPLTPTISLGITQGNPTTTINPCATSTSQSVQLTVAAHHSRHKKHHKSGNNGNGLANDLFGILQKLIEFLLQLINGGSTPPGGTPTLSPTPAPSGSPCPSVGITGSTIPTVSTGVTPTVPIALSTTPASGTPTGGLTPTMQLTPTIAATQMPTIALSPTITTSPTDVSTPTVFQATPTTIATITSPASATPILSPTPTPSTGVVTPSATPTGAPDNGLAGHLLAIMLNFIMVIINFFLSLFKHH